MTYRIPLPAGGARSELDVIDPYSSMVQRFLRREGLNRYEPETATTLLTLFEQQPGPFTLYDVGANVGLYSHLCAALFEKADVHAFEPTPDIASVCRSIARANRLDITVVEAAASDSSGTASLHLSDTSDASNSLVAGFKQAHGSIDVEQTTLDAYRERTGAAPSILKIDVETHEPAVLAGAAEIIANDRPFVVVEVLRRRKKDQGAAIQAAFDGLGYAYYPLSGDPDWIPRDTIRGSGTIERDWLLAPTELPVDFGDRWIVWQTRLAECTSNRNSRPPVVRAARAAFRRGGPAELALSARRFVVDDLVSTVKSWPERRRPVGTTDGGHESNVIERCKQLIRPVRNSDLVVAVVDRLGLLQYRIGRSGGPIDRGIARLLTLSAPPPTFRSTSVENLIELFFQIVDITGAARFVEAGAKDAGASLRAVSLPHIDQVVAFEANPYTHRRFVEAMTESGVDYRHLALAEQAGDVTFLVRLTEDGRPMADGQGSLLVRPDHEPGYEPVTVAAGRLDDVLDATNTVKPTALWIDVEGASAQVLRGASVLLASVKVVIIEVESHRRWDGQEWIDRDVIDFFASEGLAPVARDHQSRLQYNIVFARLNRPAVDGAVRAWRLARS